MVIHQDVTLVVPVQLRTAPPNCKSVDLATAWPPKPSEVGSIPAADALTADTKFASLT